MARVLYGVHGTGHGHAMRGLTIARALPQHDFLFVADDDAPEVLEAEFPVFRLPNLGTAFKNYRIDFGSTLARAAKVFWHKSGYMEKALRKIGEYKPDVCMTDLEYFTPRAARLAGLPCLTLDHQHVITSCRHSLPRNMRWDAFVQGLTPRYIFPPTEANIIVSFYAPPVLPQYNTIVCPPILRDTVIRLAPEDHGHILVYQSNSTDSRLIDFLRQSKKEAYVFGYSRTSGNCGNIHFMPKSESGFLELLGSCSYVVQGGSHTLMSEALYLGKPILSLPVESMVEQRFNALYLARLGYGMETTMKDLGPGLLRDFEAQIDNYKARIAQGNFLGNQQVFSLVDTFIREKHLDTSLPALASAQLAEVSKPNDI